MTLKFLRLSSSDSLTSSLLIWVACLSRFCLTVLTLTLTFLTLSSSLLAVLQVVVCDLASLVSSPWMLPTAVSISCCRSSSWFWVNWIWSTAPMILSSRLSTSTPLI
ncbi:hypothetical protein FKM82_027873 [Ascaphus truei]